MYLVTQRNQIVETATGLVIPLAVGDARYEAYQAWLAKGNTPQLESPTDEQKLASFELALDGYIDRVAQDLTFKDRHSLALRAAYPNEWQALGAAFGTWMDACNALAWQGKQNILNGVRPMPATAAEFLAELPPFVPPSEA